MAKSKQNPQMFPILLGEIYNCPPNNPANVVGTA